MANGESVNFCRICGCMLDNPLDDESMDCGGDCWRCVNAAENYEFDESRLKQEQADHLLMWGE